MCMLQTWLSMHCIAWFPHCAKNIQDHIGSTWDNETHKHCAQDLHLSNCLSVYVHCIHSHTFMCQLFAIEFAPGDTLSTSDVLFIPPPRAETMPSSWIAILQPIYWLVELINFINFIRGRSQPLDGYESWTASYSSSSRKPSTLNPRINKKSTIIRYTQCHARIQPDVLYKLYTKLLW